MTFRLNKIVAAALMAGALLLPISTQSAHALGFKESNSPNDAAANAQNLGTITDFDDSYDVVGQLSKPGTDLVDWFKFQVGDRANLLSDPSVTIRSLTWTTDAGTKIKRFKGGDLTLSLLDNNGNQLATSNDEGDLTYAGALLQNMDYFWKVQIANGATSTASGGYRYTFDLAAAPVPAQGASSVPEPMTMAGSIAALGMGRWMHRRRTVRKSA